MTAASLLCFIALAIGLLGYWVVDQDERWRFRKRHPPIMLAVCALAYRLVGDPAGLGYVILLAVAGVLYALSVVDGSSPKFAVHERPR